MDRNQRGGFGSADYAREELVAEMASAFACASLAIARNSPHYKISPEELDWIAQRIELLQTTVREVCERRLAPSD